MVLDDTILLFLLIPKELSTSNLTTTHKPAILRQIAEYVRLTCTLWRKLNHVQTRFDKYQQTSKELNLLCHALKTIWIILHCRKQYINPFCCSEVATSISKIADIYRAIRLEWLIVNHLYMTLLAILIRQEANLDDTPFLTIYQLASVLLAYILWNLTFVQLDAHIRNAETLHILHKVDVNNETAKQG